MNRTVNSVSSQEQHDDYRWLFDNSPLATKIIDLDGIVLDYNKAYDELMGHPDMVLHKLKPADISPPKQPDGFYSLEKIYDIIDLVKKNGEHDFEWVYERPNGYTFSALVHLDLIDYKGRECIRVIVNDHSEKAKVQRQLDEKEGNIQLLAKAIEHSMDSIMITDHQGTIRFVNVAFTRITGYTADEAVGRKSSMLKSGVQDQSFYKCMWHDITQGKVWHSKMVDRRKNGEFFPVDLTITPVFGDDGEITSFVGIKRDLTEHESFGQGDAIGRERRCVMQTNVGFRRCFDLAVE